jgi:hypothetical protein
MKGAVMLADVMSAEWRFIFYALAIMTFLAVWVRPLRTWAVQLIGTGAALALFPWVWDTF